MKRILCRLTSNQVRNGKSMQAGRPILMDPMFAAHAESRGEVVVLDSCPEYESEKAKVAKVKAENLASRRAREAGLWQWWETRVRR